MNRIFDFLKEEDGIGTVEMISFLRSHPRAAVSIDEEL